MTFYNKLRRKKNVCKQKLSTNDVLDKRIDLTSYSIRGKKKDFWEDRCCSRINYEMKTWIQLPNLTYTKNYRNESILAICPVVVRHCRLLLCIIIVIVIRLHLLGDNSASILYLHPTVKEASKKERKKMIVNRV